MGQLEKESRKRARRGQLEAIVLSALTVAGVGAVAIAAPNMLKLLKNVDLDWAAKRDPRRRLRETLSRMKRKGLIVFERRNGKNIPRLTKAGEFQARRISMGEYSIRRPLRWDRKWRIVIFDIPEKRKGIRERVRSLVSRVGFLRLQDSVWVYPYDCEDMVAILKLNLKIGRELIYIIADAIEFDNPIRKHFGLPLQ